MEDDKYGEGEAYNLPAAQREYLLMSEGNVRRSSRQEAARQRRVTVLVLVWRPAGDQPDMHVADAVAGDHLNDGNDRN